MKILTIETSCDLKEQPLQLIFPLYTQNDGNDKMHLNGKQ